MRWMMISPVTQRIKAAVILVLLMTIILPGCAVLSPIPDYLLMKQEFEPFDGAKITKEQWQQFHNSVAERYKVHDKYKSSDERPLIAEEKNLEYFYPIGNNPSYTFTLPGHPAHPAIVIRSSIYDVLDHVPGRQLLTRPYRLVEDIRLGHRGRVFLIGYYAGDEKPFMEMFLETEKLNALFRMGQPPFLHKTF